MELIEQIKKDFGQFSFVLSDDNRWSPEENTIYYTEDSFPELLHELGHANLGHKSFIQDVELLHMERDAWEWARENGKKYKVKVSDEQIEECLDMYRDWLHYRSKCPDCEQNGAQDHSDGHYYCLNCNTTWSANDARKTSLRRFK